MTNDQALEQANPVIKYDSMKWSIWLFQYKVTSKAENTKQGTNHHKQRE